MLFRREKEKILFFSPYDILFFCGSNFEKSGLSYPRAKVENGERPDGGLLRVVDDVDVDDVHWVARLLGPTVKVIHNLGIFSYHIF